MIVLPGLTDRYRNTRSGKRRWCGQVKAIIDGKWVVIAEVYGATVEEMRERKHAVSKAIEALEIKRESDHAS